MAIKVPFDFSMIIVEAITEHLIRRYLDNIDRYTPEEMADMRFDIALKSALNTMKLRVGWIMVPAYNSTQYQVQPSRRLQAKAHAAPSRLSAIFSRSTACPNSAAAGAKKGYMAIPISVPTIGTA